MNIRTATADLPEFVVSGAEKRLLIDNEWVPAAGRTFVTLDPSSGGELVRIADGDASDVDRAVAAARRAFVGHWSDTTPFERQALLLRLADLVERDAAELAVIDSVDMGAPITRTTGVGRRAVGLLRFYAGLATTIHGHTIENSLPGSVFTYTAKEPIGVVGAIVPWNSPLGIALWKVAPALAVGCTVVLKPAEQASLSLLRLAELIVEAGYPAGVVNVVTGHAEVGAAMAAHPGIDKISFTGSTAVGKQIITASAGNVTRLSLELGGKSPNIVLADADLDAAARGAVAAVFENCGQICIAGSRLFVDRRIETELVERIARLARDFRIGMPLASDTQMGPLVSEAQRERVMDFVAGGLADGARAIVGGRPIGDEAPDDGFYVLPTVFTDVEDDMAIAREEIFGPVMSVLPFDDLDEVVERANDTPYGLAAGVWTRDVSKVHGIASALQAGTVWVNCYLQLDPAVPFGGYKASGYGRESGIEQIEEYLNVKAVHVKLD